MKRGWIPVTIVTFVCSTCHVRADSAPAVAPVPQQAEITKEPLLMKDQDLVSGHARNPEFAVEPTSEMDVEEAPAGTPEVQNDQAQQNTQVQEGATENPDQVKYVSEEEPEHVKKSKNKYWQNILLAAAAITVAVIALLLVSKNNGHHAHNEH